MPKYIYILLLALLVGCNDTKPMSQTHIINQAAQIAPSERFFFTDIPSHGAIGDSATIALGGGENASQLQQQLISLAKTDGGTIVIYSTNTKLSKAVIEGAVTDIAIENKNVWLIYAGDKAFSDTLKTTVEKSGINYGFVDTLKKI